MLLQQQQKQQLHNGHALMILTQLKQCLEFHVFMVQFGSVIAAAAETATAQKSWFYYFYRVFCVEHYTEVS